MADTRPNASLPELRFNQSGMDDDGNSSNPDFYIGLGLAICSSLFIGSSFILKKKALIKLSKNEKSAGNGGHGYLKEWLWWSGLLLMVIGEIANFVAYSFAPATIVAALGVLSVLVSAILSSIFLNEFLNILGKVGCTLSIIGSIAMVTFAPEEARVETLDELASLMLAPAFVVYVAVVFASVMILICYTAPRHGNSNILVYILICSVVGSLVVVNSKGLGVVIKQMFVGVNVFQHPLTWVLIISDMIFLISQLNYLNRALDLFNTSVVTPIYYVIFTISAITSSTILFKEWKTLVIKDTIGFICGFMTIIAGIFLLHAFEDIELTIHNLPVVIHRYDSTVSEEKRLCN